MSWQERTGEVEPLLPGLNFTHNQLFFINFAQVSLDLKTVKPDKMVM